ncbi:MAG: DapH/DapD/GlmU-related protein [Pirellulales bacterium]
MNTPLTISERAAIDSSPQVLSPATSISPVKVAIKRVAGVVALVLVLPAFAVYTLGRGVVGPVKAFAGWSQAFSLIPGLLGEYLRRAFYRLTLSGCGDDACITFGTVISHPTAQLGDRAYVGAFCVLGDVTLEDDVLLGSHVSIINGGAQHGIERLDLPVREQPGQWRRVTIGRDTWIGDRSVVLADIGRHCVVGAGSVVVSPLADYAIAVGNPARVLRYRNDENPQPAAEEPVN